MSISLGMIKMWPEQFATAWRFLTVIPVGRGKALTSEKLGRSMAMFPAVGLVLGAILGGLYDLFGTLFPGTLVDLMVITSLILMTGGLHLDGVADVIDGLAGGSDREKALLIMRDSRIGAMGVIALILLILFKVVSLNQSSAAFKPALLFCMPAVGRWSMLQLAAFSKYAREGEGTGRAFADFAGRQEYLVGLIFVGTALFITLGMKGLLILCLMGMTTWLLARYFSARLGGVTGDTQGFAGELNETFFLLLGAALL